MTVNSAKRKAVLGKDIISTSEKGDTEKMEAKKKGVGKKEGGNGKS